MLRKNQLTEKLEEMLSGILKMLLREKKKIVETGIEKYGKLKAFRKTRFENKKLDNIKKKKFEERLKSQKANVNDKKK